MLLVKKSKEEKYTLCKQVKEIALFRLSIRSHTTEQTNTEATVYSSSLIVRPITKLKRRHYVFYKTILTIIVKETCSDILVSRT